MRRTTLTAVLAAMMLASAGLGAQDKPVEKQAPAVQPAGPGMTDMDKQMAQMQENVKRMQRLMERMHQAKEAKERHDLLDEHYTMMQENMQMMRGMGGPMLRDTMGGGRMMGGNPMAGMDSKQQQDFMQRRMDIMQMMMEQIMRHQQRMWLRGAK
jgi:hypothetical protein